MKNLVICFKTMTVFMLLCILPSTAKAQQCKVHVTEQGTLAQVLADSMVYAPEELAISGYIDSEDIALLNKMMGSREYPYLFSKMGMDDVPASLKRLDLSEAKIMAGRNLFNLNDKDTEQFRDPKLPFYTRKGVIEGDTYLYNMFYDCPLLESVSLPRNLQRVEGCGIGGFYNVKNLVFPSGTEYVYYGTGREERIELPETIDSIGLLFGSPHLREVICHSPEPPAVIPLDAEWNIVAECTLYVPKGSIEKYQNDIHWKKFSSILSIEDK